MHGSSNNSSSGGSSFFTSLFTADARAMVSSLSESRLAINQLLPPSASLSTAASSASSALNSLLPPFLRRPDPVLVSSASPASRFSLFGPGHLSSSSSASSASAAALSDAGMQQRWGEVVRTARVCDEAASARRQTSSAD